MIKFKILFIILSILFVFNTLVTAQENEQKNTLEDLKVDVYYLPTLQHYNDFLEKPENESLFEEARLITFDSNSHAAIGFPIYSNNMRQLLTDTVVEETFLYPANPDLQIYSKRIIRPVLVYFAGYFEIGDFILYSTNKGIKIVEMVFDPYDYQAHIPFLDDDYAFKYYDTFEEYFKSHCAFSKPVYLNGIEIPMTYVETRNKNALLSIRSVLEALDFEVGWEEKYSEVIFKKDGRELYGFITEKNIHNAAEILFMQEPQHSSYITHLDNNSYEYPYPYHYPVSDYFGCDEPVAMCEDRLCASSMFFDRFLMLFGIQLEIEVLEDRVELTSQKIEPIKWYPVPQSPEAAEL